jgi:D-amino-acid dehydrogenase
MTDSVVIVGGGHIGIACAHYLQQDGRDVTVVDQGEIGGACSRANCGFIVPSHVLPLTTPDAPAQGIQSIFQPRAAFRVKPQLRGSLIRWMWEFGRRCTHTRMMEASGTLRSLLDASASQYRELLRNPELECDWRENGMLFVFRTSKALDDFARTDTLLTSEYGLSASLIDGADLQDFEPALLDDLAGAYFYEDDSHLRPDRLNAAWTKLLETRGVRFIEQCRVEAIEKSNGRISRLQTSQGDLSADHYVFAAGAWSSSLAASLECEIPVEPGKGYSVTMTNPDTMPTHPMLMPEKHIGVTPFDDGLRIASMMEFAGFDSSIPPFRIEQLQDSAKPFLKNPTGPVIEDTWYGWRPMTWDSLPIIGRTADLSNALLATGHNMLGLSLAPVTGKAIADLVAERPTDIPLDAVAPTRFS